MDKATVESVMALAFELARIREQHGAQSGMYLSEVRALRAEAERLAAQAAPTEPPQEFESAQGRALASAWAEGWAQCRDAEYVGEEAESEAFNQSATLAQCLHADQTRFQGGLSNDELRRAWSAKLPNVIPTDEQLTAFALGIEAAAQPSQAPVVQAVQAGEYPPLPEPKLARVRCDQCEGSGFLRVSPDPERSDEACSACRGRGWSSETLVHVEDDIRAFADATCAMRASSGATPADVRMLTPEEVADCVPLTAKLVTNEGVDVGVLLTAQELKSFGENYKNAGKRIPADGVIGGV